MNKMSKKVIQGFVLILIVSLLLFLQFGGPGVFTGFVIFDQSNEGDFEDGTYVNTEYNGSSIVLSENELTGSYTSHVFDASRLADWNNITLVGGRPLNGYLFAVDNQADIFKSVDEGVTWTLTKEQMICLVTFLEVYLF
jgi:hypothetical protein